MILSHCTVHTFVYLLNARNVLFKFIAPTSQRCSILQSCILVSTICLIWLLDATQCVIHNQLLLTVSCQRQLQTIFVRNGLNR